MQFLHSQDTQPVKKLDASSPGRLVIPDFNQHSSTIEVKELTPPPTKAEKRKPQEWITQVATQEEVRSEPPLQANRLSADKVQFLHSQDTQPVKKLDASSPGRLVIPDFNQHSSTIEVKELTPPPTKAEKRKPEEWITQVATQEEVRSEPPLQANRLSADKVQFLHSQDTQPVKKLDASSPGRLVIPNFNQHSSTIEVKELSPPPTKAEKRKPQEWITQVATQEEVRSEPPLQANRLSADKVQFLHSQDTQPVKKLDASSPGRLVIPDFNQHSSTIEVKELTPPPTKADKRKPEEWITQVATQEEVRSEPPLQANRLSADKVQFLHSQDTQPVKKLDASSPGRLVIPDFNQHSSTIEVKELSPPPTKAEKRKPQEWITQVATQEEVRSEPPLQANRLSADKVQFLHSQDTQPVKKLDASSPGRLVIPDFNQHSSTIEVKELTPPPTKAEKRKPEEWITQVATQEEVRSEPPLQANRLSADKVQFLHSQDTQPVKKLDASSPGRLVIPDFNQHSSTIEVKELTPPPTKAEKRKPEEWITQVATQEEVRSEPPLQANRLSADKVQFLHSQDTQPVKKLDASSPGRLVIPDFNQHSSTIEVKELTPPPTKAEKRKPEEWITQVATQEEVRSEPPLQANRLSADKVQFLHSQDTQPVKKLDASSPGRLVIPDFNQHSSTIEVKELTPPPTKADKRKPEEWITQVATQEEVRSEPPLQANRLSADKVQFLHSQDTQPVKKLDASSPGRLVIPDFNQHSSTIEVKELTPPPTKAEKRKPQEWITQVATQEEVRSEPPLQANRLSADKVQFLHSQDTQPVKKLDASSPGRLVIPDFNQHSSTIEVKELTPPPTKAEKRKPEEWITQVATQEEVRSEPPLQANRLSADKVQFLHSQDTQPVKKLDASSPGRLVIPNFNQHSSTIEVKELSPPPTKAEKRKPQEWITQVATQEEVRSEPPLQANRLSADKVQFLHSQDTQPVKKLDASSPGRLVIPDFNQHSSTIEVKELTPPPTKAEKRKPQEWITQVATQEEVRSEPPLQANRLSADKVQFLHSQDTQPVKKLDASSPGRLVIPDFNQHSSTIEVKELTPPPTKAEKRKPQEWITQVATQEEVRSEPPLQANRLSADKVQFLHSQDTQPVKKLDASSPGRLVIPNFNQHSSTIEVKELTPPPTKAEKRKPQEWITQVATQEEVRSEPPLQANRLSADKVQFLHSQDTQPVKKLDASSPGRLVIPDFNQHSSTIEVKELTPPPTKAEKRKPQEWITQVATQEEVRSEPPLQANRLSADKVQFLHSQDTQPVKKLDASSPGRLVIPDFNQHSSTIEVKELTPPPTKAEKRKPQEWITQVATQEEVRSEPPLQANRLSADKVQFLHSQDTQPVKKLDASSPGRLVIPDFNQHSSTIEVKELTPPPTKAEKRKPQEWITQVATQEEVRSEPPLQANRLSADKVQFLHSQDTQPIKKLDASSPGRLVIPNFNQHSSTIEVKELTPPPTKAEKRKPQEWITQVATQEEVRSEPPLQANRLSADKVQFLHSQDTQPVKKLDASSPGRLVIPNFNQHSSTIEVKEQFLHSQDTQPVKKLDDFLSSAKTLLKSWMLPLLRLVIPNFNQHSSTIEVKELTPIQQKQTHLRVDNTGSYSGEKSDQNRHFRLTGCQQTKCNFFTAKTHSRLKSWMLPLLADFSFRTLISTVPP